MSRSRQTVTIDRREAQYEIDCIGYIDQTFHVFGAKVFIYHRDKDGKLLGPDDGDELVLEPDLLPEWLNEAISAELFPDDDDWRFHAEAL